MAPQRTREAALAGSWYPGTEAACRRKIEGMREAPPERTGRGGIVPHAGWEYSGAVALQVLQAVAAAEPKPELLLLFGTHMGPSSPPHIARAAGFETPLGTIVAEEELASEIAKLLQLRDDPADSRWGGGPDNTVEVQLPLIKHLLPEVKLVVISPPASQEAMEIGRVATEMASTRGRPMAIVGSTDLTHYGARFGFAPKGHGDEAAEWVKKENDANLIERVLALDPEGVLAEASRNHNACVPGAVAATLAGAEVLQLSAATLLDYRNSYDLQPSSSFVGYAGVLLHG